MSELMEVSFDNLNIDQIIGIFKEISIKVNGLNPNLEIDVIKNELFYSAEPSHMSFTADKINLDQYLFISYVQIILLKYDEIYSLEFNFIGGDSLDNLDVPVEALCKFSTQIAKKYQIQDYYGGLEPASDEDTRIFTGTELGPFLI